MNYEKSCGAVIYRCAAGTLEFLAIKSINDHWGFPKGHMELSETEEETCLREVLEETGISLSLKAGFRVVDSYIMEDCVKKDVVFFLGTTENFSIKVQPEEIVAYKWADFNEIYNLLSFDSSRNILTKAKDFLNTVH